MKHYPRWIPQTGMQTGTQWFMYLISQEISSNTHQQGKHSQELQRDTVTLKAELAGSLAETNNRTKKNLGSWAF